MILEVFPLTTNPQRPISLQLVIDSRVVFESRGKWLHPLFDLEDYLQAHPTKIAQGEIRDKVIGKAAALLILRLGPGKVHGEVMSDLAIEVFERAELPFSYNEKVERIACKTEVLLKEIDDPDLAYEILEERAGR